MSVMVFLPSSKLNHVPRIRTGILHCPWLSVVMKIGKIINKNSDKCKSKNVFYILVIIIVYSLGSYTIITVQKNNNIQEIAYNHSARSDFHFPPLS